MLTLRYSHTLDLTPLIPYLRAANPSTGAQGKGRGPSYLAADIPSSLVGDPSPASEAAKTTLLSFLVKGLILAMQEHPILRAKAVGQDNERSLDIRKDGIIGVAVSGEWLSPIAFNVQHQEKLSRIDHRPQVRTRYTLITSESSFGASLRHHRQVGSAAG